MKTLILSCLAAIAVLSITGCETTDDTTYVTPAATSSTTTTTTEETTSRRPGQTIRTQTTESY